MVSTPVCAQGLDEQARVDLGTVILTSRKRDEFAFDAPVSASVIDGRTLQFGNLEPGAEIARRTPNYNFVDFAQPGNHFGSIRGVGPLGVPLNSLDNTIGFSVDGVPTTSFGFSPTLFDVERVEVLRGPQGTLFGRNALGGSVNIINRRADGEREFRLGVEAGEHGTLKVDAAVGGWLIRDVLAGRAALRFQNYDGDIPNPIIGGDDGDAEILAGRLTLGFFSDGPFSASLTLGREVDERANPFLMLIEAPDFPVSGSDIALVGEREIDHFTLSTEWESEHFTFTSITGYQDIDTFVVADDTDAFLQASLPFNAGRPLSDFNDPDQDLSINREGEAIFTQEFRLNSNENSSIEWVAGLSYFRSDFYQDREQTSTTSPLLNGTYDTDIVSETIAIFGDISLPVTDRLTFSAGLRAARDEQRFDSTFVSNGFPGAVPQYTQRSEWEEEYLTGHVSVDYRWNENWMSYASVASGYASGGYERYTVNAYLGADTPPFLPSRIWAYEIGTKAQLMDGRVQLSGALFFNDVRDGQLFDFDGTTFEIFFGNQDYQTYGAEFEVAAELAPDVTMRGALGLTESRLGSVDPTSLSALNGAEKGNDVPNTPNVTASIGLDVRRPLQLFGAMGDGILSADVSYTGARQADVANSYEISDYTIANLTLGWSYNNLEVYAFGRNLFDERPIYFASTFAPDSHSAIVGKGRQLGVGVNFTW